MSPIWTLLLIAVPLIGALMVAFGNEDRAYGSSLRTMFATLIPGAMMQIGRAHV